MAKKQTQTVSIRLTMNGSQAESTMESLTRRLGKMKDEFNSMKSALKASGLNIKTATEQQFADAGLGEDFAKRFQQTKQDITNYEKLVKSSTVTIADLTKRVLDITHMTKEDIEKTMRDIQRLYAGMAPDTDKDKQRMLTLQSLYEQATQARAKLNVQQMTGADAARIYTKAQELMTQGLRAEASELRDIAEALGRAAKAEGISVAESQLYLQAQAEVNRVLQARGTAFVDAAKGAETLAKAQDMVKLSREGKADTSIEKTAYDNSIAQRKQAEQELLAAEQKRAQITADLDQKKVQADQKRAANKKKIDDAEDEVNRRRAALTQEALAAHYEHIPLAKKLNDEMQKESEISRHINELSLQQGSINRRIVQYKNEIARIDREIAAEQAKGSNADANKLNQLNVDKGSFSGLIIDEQKKLGTITQEIENQNAALQRQQNVVAPLKKRFEELEAVWKGQEEARRKLVEAEDALRKARRNATSYDNKEKNADAKGRQALEEEVRLAKEKVDQLKTAEQTALQVYQNALKYGGVDITTLRQMYQELEFIRDHTKDNEKVNQMNITLRDMKQRIEELTTARRPLAEIFKDIKGAKSIDEMTRFKTELEAALKSIGNEALYQKGKKELDALTERIKNFSQLKPRKLSEILADLSDAKSLGQLERLRDELKLAFKTLEDPSDIKLAKEKFDAVEMMIKNWGTETVNAFQVLKDPNNYNLSQIQAAIKQFEQQLADTKLGPQYERRRQMLRQNIATLQQYVKAEEEAAKAPRMSAEQAGKIARGEVADATVAQLREAKQVLEAFRETLKATDADGLKNVNADLQKIEQTFDRINGKAKEAMSKDVAQNVVQSAREMVSKIRTEGAGAVGAKAVDDMIAQARRAQEANDITLRTRQEAAAVERELTEIVKGQNVVMLEQETITKAVADADKLIKDGATANVGTLRETIEVYRQMVAQENIDIQTKQQYAATLRQLEELYKNGRIDAAATEQKYQQMLGADGRVNGSTKVTEVKALIEAFRQLAVQEGTTAEEAARYDQYVRNLEQSTKSQTTAIKEQMSIEQARRIARGEELASVEKMEQALKVIEQTWKQVSLNAHVFSPPELDAENEKLRQMKSHLEDLKRQRDEGAAASNRDRTIGNAYVTMQNKLSEGRSSSLNNQRDEYIENRSRLVSNLDSMKLKGLEDSFAYKQQKQELADLETRYAPVKAKIAEIRSECARTIMEARRQANEEGAAIVSVIGAQEQAIREQQQRITDGTQGASKQRIDELKSEAVQLKENIKLLSEMPKYTADQLSRAQTIGNNPQAEGVLIGELTKAKDVLEAFKQSLATTDETGLKKVNDQLKNIQNEIDRVNDKAKATTAMTKEEAEKAANNLQSLITKYRTQGAASVDAKEMNDAIAAAKKAQSATGISIQLSQKAAAAEREATEIMRGKNQVLLEQATIDKAVADAQNHLTAGNQAEVDKVRETIEVYKQMVAQDGLSIEKKKEYIETLQRLESLYKNGVVDAKQMNDAYAKLFNGGGIRPDVQVQEIQKVIDGYRQLKTQYGVTAENAKLYDQRINELEQSMRREAASTSKAKSEAQQFAMSEQEIANVMKNLKNATPETLEKTMLALRNKIKDSETSLKDFVKASMDLRKVQRQVSQVNREVDATNKALDKQGDFITRAAGKLMQYMGIFGGMMLVRQKVTEAFQANMKFDDSLSNIRKTTGLTSEAVLMLADNIKRIDTRTTLDDMMELSYSAGRLGVKGVSDIMGFTRAANHLKVALGEQLGDKAADAVESIMKVSSIMGAVDTEGLENALEKVGSSINHITMNSQATAEPMINFMRRIGGLGRAAGMQVSEVAGLAGAINALGQNTEMAATSVSSIMVQISRNSQKVANALKLTAEEQQRFFLDIESGHMADAFLTVLKKVNESGGLSHLGTIVKDLGSDGKRTVQVINTLAQNYTTVADMIKMSNDAYEEGTSAINEYNIKNENTAALWERLKNNFSKNIVNKDFIDWTKEILIDLQDLPDHIAKGASNFKWIIDIFSNLFGWLLKCHNVMAALAQAMLFRSMASGLAVMGSWIKQTALFTKQLIATRFAVIKTEIATKGLVATIKGANFGNVFMTVAAVLLYIANIAQRAKAEMKEIREKQAQVFEDAKSQFETTTAAINTVLEKLYHLEEGTEEYKKTIDEINKTYGGYLTNLIKEGEAYAVIEEKLKLVNRQMKIKALADAQRQNAETIKQENQLAEGQDINAIIREAAKYMPNYKEDDRQAVQQAESAASRYVTELLHQDADGNFDRLGNLFRVSVDSEGKTKYDLNWFGGLSVTDEEREAQRESVKELARAFGLDPAHTDNGLLQRMYGQDSGSLGGAFDWLFGTRSEHTGVGGAIVDYLNTVAARNFKIDTSNQTARIEAGNEAADNYEAYKKDVEADWAKIADDVEYRNALLNGAIRSEQEDTDYWAKQKHDGGKYSTIDSRKKKTEEIEAFLNNVDENLVNIEALINAGNTADMFGNNLKQLKDMWTMRQKNAQDLLGVIRVGKLENMTDKGDPDKKANQKGQEEYKNIIAKVEEFYKHRAEEMEDEFNHGLMTKYDYEQQLKDNEQLLQRSLGSVREAIGNESEQYNQLWLKRIEAMEEEQRKVGNVKSADALHRIKETSTTAGGVRDIRKLLTMGNDGDTAIISEILKNAAENERKDAARDVEKYETDLKAMLERNPMGKLTDEFLQEFQQLGLMFASLRLQADEVSGDIATDQARLRAKTQQVMAEYLKLGKATAQFDVSSQQGLDAYREYVGKLPMLGEEAAKQSDEKLRSLYYETYNYAEQYGEQITKLMEKQRKVWTKMYEQTRTHLDLLSRQHDVEHLMKGNAVFVPQEPSAEDKRNAAKLQEKLQELLDERALTIDINPDSDSLPDLNAEIDKLQQKIDDLLHPQDRLQISLGSEQLTKMGGSDRMKLEEDIELKRIKLEDEYQKWMAEQAKRRQELESAKAGFEALDQKKAAGEAVDENQYNTAAMQVQDAEDMLQRVQDAPEAVQQATDAMAQSIVALWEVTNSWVSEMEQAFEKFTDSFISFRSFYDDKGSIADNIFGTKAERQQAAGALIDELKKTVRKSIVEYTRLRVQKSVQDKMEVLSAQWAEKAKLLFHKEAKNEETAVDITANTVQTTVDTLETETEIKNSKRGRDEAIKDKAEETGATTMGNLAQAVSKAFAELGPIAGAIAAGVVSAAIGAVLTMAMNALGHDNHGSTGTTSAKLATGMLTYDRGNVQSFRGVNTYDGGGAKPKSINMLPVVGDDGRVYMVPEGDLMGKNDMSNYTGMVTRPTYTTVGGQPALVGERGPEMVIGRETTSAMQMYRPDLLREIIEFDRNRSRGFAKTFDSGNLSSVNSEQLSANNEGAAASQQELLAMLDANAAMMAQMAEVIDRLSAQVEKGIGVRMYGEDGVVNAAAKGFADARRMGTNKYVTRLFQR